MARPVRFSFLRGTGSSLEVLYGQVSITPSQMHTLASSAVLPAPTTLDLVNGVAVAPSVVPTPAPVDGKIAWAYVVKVTNTHGKSWEYMVGVPDGTAEINFNVLPRYYETKPEAFGEGPPGPAGTAATIAVGTVASGTTPAVTNTGTSTDAVLNFTLAKGDKGDTGAGVPTGGTALQVVRKNSANTSTEWATADKALVGLSNVDNTSDANKPVSTAQQEAISSSTTTENNLYTASRVPSLYPIGVSVMNVRTSDGWPEVFGSHAGFTRVTTERPRTLVSVIQYASAYVAGTNGNLDSNTILYRIGTTEDVWGAWQELARAVEGGYAPMQMSVYQNVVIGLGALANATDLKVRNNTVYGIGAMANASRARYNDMYGLNAGYSLDSGISESDTTFKATRNSGFGSNTQRFNKTGHNNVSMGRNSLQCNEIGTDNVYIGAGAGSGSAPISLSGEIENQIPLNVNNSTAIGVSALESSSGDGNTAVGFRSSQNVKKSLRNLSFGDNALLNLDKNTAPNGKQRVTTSISVGYAFAGGVITITHPGNTMQAGYLVAITFPGYEIQYLPVGVVSGTTNYTLVSAATSFPDASGTATISWYSNNTDARLNNYNVALGPNALYNLEGNYTDPAASASNVGIGLNSSRNMQDGSPATRLSNTIAIGPNTSVSGDKQMQLGANDIDVYAGKAIQLRSDARDKTDVQSTELGLDFITKLRPVDFRWDRRSDYYVYDENGDVIDTPTPDGSRKGSRYHHGLIAQEVRKVIADTGIDFGGFQDHTVNGGNDVLSVGYEELIAPLIKAVQELSAKVDELSGK